MKRRFHSSARLSLSTSVLDAGDSADFFASGSSGSALAGLICHSSFWSIFMSRALFSRSTASWYSTSLSRTSRLSLMEESLTSLSATNPAEPPTAISVPPSSIHFLSLSTTFSSSTLPRPLPSGSIRTLYFRRSIKFRFCILIGELRSLSLLSSIYQMEPNEPELTGH